MLYYSLVVAIKKLWTCTTVTNLGFPETSVNFNVRTNQQNVGLKFRVTNAVHLKKPSLPFNESGIFEFMGLIIFL